MMGKADLERALNEDFDLFILDLMLTGMWMALRSASRFARRRIRRSLWYQPRRMILIKSVVWVWARMII